MSRIGKKPVAVPDGVTVEIKDLMVKVKGTKGELEYGLPAGISVNVEGNELVVSRSSDEKNVRAFHGLARSIISNMVEGVSKGFEKRLEIHGVGYRANANGREIDFQLGFSHPVKLKAPEGVEVNMDKDAKNEIVITGIDKQVIGEFAANIRKLRKPEPYKGKGIRYKGEYVRKKAGKTAAK